MIIFSCFSSKSYVVTPHLDSLVETVQMRGLNICIYAELTKIIPNYSRTSIVRNASDFQLFFELSEFRTYRVGFFRIVGKFRAYKITACSGRMCEITSYGVVTCSTKPERECKQLL